MLALSLIINQELGSVRSIDNIRALYLEELEMYPNSFEKINNVST